MQTPQQRIGDLTGDILAGIGDGVVVAGADGAVVIWNRAAEELTGIAAQDAEGRDARAVLADIPVAAGNPTRTARSRPCPCG